MNMISTGTFLEEMDTSSKHEALVKKLVGAWEKKNSKIARAGGVSLMALTLAACGDDDDTPFSQADVDAAKAAAKAEGVAEGVASVDITSDNAAVAEAARAEGVASVDITSDNASVIAAAVATAEAAKDAEIATLQASYDALVATNSALQASYDALIAPKSLAATTETDSLQGGNGNDAFTAAAGTVAAADRFNDGSTTDSDTLTITHSTAPGAFTSTNIETININLNALGALTVDAANITGATTLTVTRGDVVVGGATLTGNKAVQIDNVDSSAIGSITVGAGTTTVDINSAAADKAGHVLNLDNATGAITVDGAATINAANSTDVRIDAVTNTAVAETGKATVINAANAATVITDAGLTGSVTINAAKATNIDVLDAQGGATVNAATGHTADSIIDIRDIDSSGATVTVGTGVDDSTTAGNIAIDLLLDGTAAATDAATVSGAGHIELDIDGTGGQLVEVLTLSGNGAAVVYDLQGGSPTSITKAGTQSVEVMGALSAFAGKTVTNIDVLDVISGDNTAMDGSLFTGVGKIDFGADSTNQALTLNSGQTIEFTSDQTTGTNLDFSAAGGGDLTIVAGDDNGASAAVGTIALNSFNAAAGATVVGTVTIEASIANVTASATVLGAKQNLVITGDEDVTLGAVTADSVSAANSTGIINMTSANNVDVVTLGSGNDILVVNDATGDATGNGDTVDTGAGNDTITITDTASTSTFNAGAGDDTINVDDANSNIVVLGGAGADNFATAVAFAGTIIGGDGADTITIDADAAVAFGATFAFSGIEELDITAVSSKTVEMTGAQLANNSTLVLDGNAATDVFNVNTASTATAAKSADLSNVTVKTGATVGITVTGNVGVDTITGGVASETFTQTLSADSIEGGGTTNADTYVAVTALAPGGGSANSVGSVVNLGSTAVSTAAITSATSSYIAGSLTEVAAGKVAYMFSANAAANSADMDTVGGIENVTGSAGIDYIVGTTGNNVITGEAGADYISAGAGADTVTGGNGIDTILLGAADAVADTVSFTGVAAATHRDTVSNFETTIDKIGLDVDNTTVATAADATAVTEDEATAAANGNGAAYDLAAALATGTNALDLVTLDTAVLTNIANADLSAATDGTELLKALVAAGGGNTASQITVDTANDSFYLATDDGTNGYLYLVANGAGNTAVIASEIALVATMSGDADFGDILAANTIMVA